MAARSDKDIKLSNATLPDLPGDVARPTYDRAQLRPGIVHIGLGNFHRAHQAWYLHRLMQAGDAQDWAIIGAGVRPYDMAMRDKLLAQDCLSTLIELAPANSTAEVIGPVINYLPIRDDNAPLIRAMADPAIRIVSLTITEGGYFTDPATGTLALTAPEIRHDIETPNTPQTVFGAIVRALKIRRAAAHPPFTVQSCDNLRGNGDITRQAVVALARQTDPDLARWIDDKGAFPNAMVDCIVPATGPDEMALARGFGIKDAAPVTHESYRQWVIEDAFCNGRPDWDKVGAIFTDNVHAYETMKIRILNAGHQILANVSELMSVATIADALQTPAIRAFFQKVQHEEILPYVAPVPGTTPAQYLHLVERRFANPRILDTPRRVAFDGSSRHPGFVLPILSDALRAEGPIDGLCLVEALWARMCAGTRDDGTLIAPNDPHWADLQATALAARDAPQAWLAQHHIYGPLAQDQRVATRFEHWLRLIWQTHSNAALEAYLRAEKAFDGA